MCACVRQNYFVFSKQILSMRCKTSSSSNNKLNIQTQNDSFHCSLNKFHLILFLQCGNFCMWNDCDNFCQSHFFSSCGTKKPVFVNTKTFRKNWRNFSHWVPFRFHRTEQRTSWAWFHCIQIVFRWIYSIPNKLRLIDFDCCFFVAKIRSPGNTNHHWLWYHFDVFIHS